MSYCRIGSRTFFSKADRSTSAARATKHGLWLIQHDVKSIDNAPASEIVILTNDYQVTYLDALPIGHVVVIRVVITDVVVVDV